MSMRKSLAADRARRASRLSSPAAAASPSEAPRPRPPARAQPPPPPPRARRRQGSGLHRRQGHLRGHRPRRREGQAHGRSQVRRRCTRTASSAGRRRQGRRPRRRPRVREERRHRHLSRAHRGRRPSTSRAATTRPHIVVLQVGQPLKIRNSDDTLHNIHPRPTAQRRVQHRPAAQGHGDDAKTFDKTEVMIPVGCDVHPWMRSYISVLDNPFFAVTEGRRQVRDQGAARRRVRDRGLHEKLKSQTGKITVKDGEKRHAGPAVQGLGLFR